VLGIPLALYMDNMAETVKRLIMRKRDLESNEKLSKLQRFILVALLESKYAAMSQKEFNQFIYNTWFRKYWAATAQASLSRTYKRLKARGFLSNNCKLTLAGSLMAYNVWHQCSREYLHEFDLKGPPPEVLQLLKAARRQ